MRCSVILAAAIGLLVVACASPRVDAYDNGLGAFPPLGWSTWYVEQRRAIFALTSELHRADPLAVPSHRCTDDLCGLIDKCTQQEIQSIADAFVSTGMHDLGYEWLVLDDCWERDHEVGVNMIDAENGSKVLLSSRVRPVLEVKGGSSSTCVIDLQLPR